MELTRSNTPLRLLVTVVYLAGLFGIVASGGGSDSDTTGISYTGNIDPAVITSFNAADWSKTS